MWKPTAILASFCVAILLALRFIGQLNTGELARDIAIILGWIVTVLVATHQQTAAQRENDRLKRDDLRRSLQVEAFRHVSDAAIRFSGEVSEISSTYSVTAFTLSRPAILPLESVIRAVYSDTNKHFVGLQQSMSRFAFVVETYQLTVSDLHHLYLYICFRIDDVTQRISSLPIQVPETHALTNADARINFQRECANIGESLNNIRLFIGDLRVELMNSLVGPLFDRRAPRRQPLKPSIKTLVELATPEAVAAEQQQRLIDAVVGGIDPPREKERPA